MSAAAGRAASTVFVSGHSYLDTGFSTVTEIVDTATGTGHGSLETFRIVKDGRPYRSVDINFWGVTFASDDEFYATLASRGRTYLVRGRVAAREVTVLRENVECPSLSPDGTKIAFKKASGDSAARRWRFTLLDLRTGVETPLPETRSIEDQLAWLDDDHLMYGVPRNRPHRRVGDAAVGREAPDARARRGLAGRGEALDRRPPPPRPTAWCAARPRGRWP